MLKLFILFSCVAAGCAACAEPAGAQLKSARAVLDAGRAEEAFAGYQAVLEASDEDAARNKALAGQARARFEQGRFAEAARLFQRAADNAEETPTMRAEWLSRAADAVYASGQPAEAARMYRHVYTLFPESPLAGEMLLRAADALARGGDTRAALEAFARAAEADPAPDAEARVRQGEILARQGEVAACAALVEPVIHNENDALRGRALLAMGRAHAAASEWEEALPFFESAKNTPETADEAAWLCVPVLQRLGRVDEAREVAKKVAGASSSQVNGKTIAIREQDAPTTEALLWLLRDAYNTGRFHEVPALADDFAVASPRDARVGAAWVWAARAAVLAGDFNHAVDIIGRLRRELPAGAGLAEGVFIQGVALLELGRFGEAAMVFDDLVTRLPESAWTTRAWLRKGDALYLLGAGGDAWFAAAAAAYEEALLRYDITPAERVEALYKKGRALERMNRATDARDVYAVGVAEPFLEAWQGNGLATKEAAEWFMRAVFRAADLLAAEDAAGLLENAAATGAPGAAEAVARAEFLRKKGD